MTKTFSRRDVLCGTAGLAAAATFPAPARSEWRPTEAVRIIIPAAPGGTTDVMGRLVAQHLQVSWGQSTIVENKSGGGGTIAMTDYVRQKPDGHTIMIGNPGSDSIYLPVEITNLNVVGEWRAASATSPGRVRPVRLRP